MTEVHFYKPEVPLSISIDRVEGRAMTNNLLERLRATWANSHNKPWNPDGAEAADRIEALEAENERLKNILRDCNPESMSWLDARDAALGETQ